MKIYKIVLLLGAFAIASTDAVQLRKMADFENKLSQQNLSIEDKVKVGKDLQSFIQANAFTTPTDAENQAKIAEVMRAITLWDHLKVAAGVGYYNPALTFLTDPVFNKLVDDIKEKNKNYTNNPMFRGKDWNG